MNLINQTPNFRMAKMIDQFYECNPSKQIVSNNDSLDFNSSVLIDIPDLSFVAPYDGDYMACVFIGINPSRNISAFVAFANGGISISDSATPKYLLKNKLNGIEITVKILDIKKGDIVTPQLNTAGNDCDLLGIRRLLLSRWV